VVGLCSSYEGDKNMLQVLIFVAAWCNVPAMSMTFKDMTMCRRIMIDCIYPKGTESKNYTEQKLNNKAMECARRQKI